MFRMDGYPNPWPRWHSQEPIEYIGFAGIPVQVASVVEIVRRLRNAELHETAEKVIEAWAREERMVSLDAFDRESLLFILLDALPELAALRAVLLRDHIRRKANEH